MEELRRFTGQWGGSIAYRTHDAQYWGVPQRRKRIALVVDFRGESAAEILFERKSVSGNLETSREEKKDIARSAEKSIDSTNRMSLFDSQPYHDYREMGDTCQSVSAQYGTGGNNMPFVVNEREDSQRLMTFQAFGVNSEGENVTSTIKASDDKHITDLVLDTEQMLTVRRLTPLECTRLQGYPDGWVDIPGASDSAKYKALGNSICLPFWEHLAHRFAQYGNVRTIGSLFAGIGGFELVFKRAGAATSWSSEIEPFCQRVVAYHTERGDL